jgi:hypothetical protein
MIRLKEGLRSCYLIDLSANAFFCHLEVLISFPLIDREKMCLKRLLFSLLFMGLVTYNVDSILDGGKINWSKYSYLVKVSIKHDLIFLFVRFLLKVASRISKVVVVP